MKLFILSLITLLSLNTFAAKSTTQSNNSKEVIRVANVLLANSAVVAQLDTELLSIHEYTITDLGDGKTSYVFKLERNCFCIPKVGTLTIVEDLKPTYADGPIAYTVKLDIVQQ